MPLQESSKLPQNKMKCLCEGEFPLNPVHLNMSCVSMEYCFAFARVCLCTSLTISFAWTVAFSSQRVSCYFFFLYCKCANIIESANISFRTNRISVSQQWMFSCFIKKMLWLSRRTGVTVGSCTGHCLLLVWFKMYLSDVAMNEPPGSLSATWNLQVVYIITITTISNMLN